MKILNKDLLFTRIQIQKLHKPKTKNTIKKQRQTAFENLKHIIWECNCCKGLGLPHCQQKFR